MVNMKLLIFIKLVLQKFKKIIINKKTAGKYISSGIFKVTIQTIVSFIVLRWLLPEDLGKWQSFMVFAGYIGVLTLGTTSGLNRDLPFYLGKGQKDIALNKLKACGFYATYLSISLMTLISFASVFLRYLNILSTEATIMFVFAFMNVAFKIQINFLGATFRSAQAFDRLTTIQMLNSGLYILLIPLIYYLNIWGYVIYQTVQVLFMYIGYYVYRPYKVKYIYDFNEIVKLIKTGLPMYIWNFLLGFSRSLPRLLLITFGTPFLVGIYSPAGSINSIMQNLPDYTNRYLFPQMAFKYGKTNSKKAVFLYAKRAAIIMFFIMLTGAILVCFLIPPVFSSFFPNYIDGVLAAQITIFSGVFYSINALFHNTLNSMKLYAIFKYIITLKIIFIPLFTFLVKLMLSDLLSSVAIGLLLTELLSLLNYYYHLIRLCKN